MKSCNALRFLFNATVPPKNKGWSSCHPEFMSVFVFLSSVQC